MRKAIKALNPNITDSDIDRFKPDYGSFAWCVAFAPADDPQIAVACVIPQGESSSYAVLPIREVLGQYFGLLKEEKDEEKDKEENKDMKKEDIKEDKNTDNNSEKKNSDDNKVEEDDRTRDLDSDIEGID